MTVVAVELGSLSVGGADGDGTAGDCDTTGHPSILGLEVAVPGSAHATADFIAIIVLTQDEVHDTANGIGTIDRGSTVLENFHAFDHRNRDVVQVTDGAATVEEHQGRKVAQGNIGGAVATIV